MLRPDTIGIRTDSLIVALDAPVRSTSLICKVSIRIVAEDNWDADAVVGIKSDRLPKKKTAMVRIRSSSQAHALLSVKVRSAEAVALREKLYAPLKIAAVVRELSEGGYAADRVLSGTGLQAEALTDPNTRTSIEQLLIVGRNAIRLCHTPGLGLAVGRRMHVTSYGMYGYALLCAGTLRQAFDTAMRYHPLATPVMRIEWKEDREKATWVLSNHEDMHIADLT